MAAGLSQKALAERANLSTRAISDLERSINQASRSATLDALLQALALSEEQRHALVAAARASALIDVVVATPLYVLPLPPTQLIGREQDIARVIALLRGDSARLLTLLGPAGVGKTHLGLDVAHRLRGDFKDGVVFVTLAATADAAVVPALIAQALRLRESADISPAQQTIDFLAEKHLLLVLDNFEQVIAAGASVAELLQNCPHLRILAHR